MKALHANGFPVPRPLENNRHAVLMSLIDATPLYQVVYHIVNAASQPSGGVVDLYQS